MLSDKVREILKSCLISLEEEQVPPQELEIQEDQVAKEDSTESPVLHETRVTLSSCYEFVDPQNKCAYEQRVETFNSRWWAFKPASLSPRVCALYGWQCVRENIAKCVSCKSCLYAGLPTVSKHKLYNECCEQVLKKVKDSHQKGCMWLAAPSPETFRNVTVTLSKEFWNEFVECVNELSKNDFYLPTVTVSDLPSELVDISQKLLEIMGSDTLDIVPILLAILGWHKAATVIPMLYCKYCHRKVGCVNFERSDDDVIEEQTVSIFQQGEQSCVQLNEEELTLADQNENDKLLPTEETIIYDTSSGDLNDSLKQQQQQSFDNNSSEGVYLTDGSAQSKFDLIGTGVADDAANIITQTLVDLVSDQKHSVIDSEEPTDSDDPQTAIMQVDAWEDSNSEEEKNETNQGADILEGHNKDSPQISLGNNELKTDHITKHGLKREMLQISVNSIARKKIRLHYNPVDQHWSWCPWVNKCVPESDIGSCEQLGWNVYAQTLITLACRYGKKADDWKNNSQFSSIVSGIPSICELLD